MSGPPAVDSPLTRAGSAVNCPFSGYPATMALSPVFAAAVNYHDTGYALTASQVENDARGWARATQKVSTQRCSPGG